MLSASYDTSPLEYLNHVRANVRTVCIQTDDVNLIPYYSRWAFEGQVGEIMKTMKGRPTKCLHCYEVGHIKKECKAPYCTRCRSVGHATETCVESVSYAAMLAGISDEPPTVDDHAIVDEDIDYTVDTQSNPIQTLTLAILPSSPKIVVADVAITVESDVGDDSPLSNTPALLGMETLVKPTGPEANSQLIASSNDVQSLDPALNISCLMT